MLGHRHRANSAHPCRQERGRLEMVAVDGVVIMGKRQSNLSGDRSREAI